MTKRNERNSLPIVLIILMCALSVTTTGQISELYRRPKNVETRWSSFENPTGGKGIGGFTNRGAKGHPFEPLEAGDRKVLLDVKGSGMIRRIWCTVNDHTTQTLRSLRLDMYWDNALTPAVSVPFGDFFASMIERPVAFESALISNPEGKSFNCIIPMPFRKAAKIVLTNEAPYKVRLLYYDIDYVLGMKHKRDVMYFHASWRREMPTTLARDFEILPRVTGSGRFLGAVIGVICNPHDIGWWGEGEVKIFLDGDTLLPTLVGTGTEDYIGTGWGQGVYAHRYQGSLISDKRKKHYVFYRFHVPDPVYFEENARVTIQQIGGEAKNLVIEMLREGLPIVPVTISWKDNFVRFLDEVEPVDLEKHDSPMKGWCNYFRSDDVCAVAYFYLDRPENGLPSLASVNERIASTKW